MAHQLIRGTASFPGLPVGVFAGKYTASYDHQPGVVVLSIGEVDLSGVSGIGDVLFTDIGGASVVLKACRLVDIAVDWKPNGHTIHLMFQDRRWTWLYATVHGWYNQPCIRTATVPVLPDPTQQQDAPPVPDAQLYPDGYVPDIQEWTRKSARQLGELLFKAMGEQTYDVAALPDDVYPQTDWDAANPAAELQNLCELYGCRLNYNVGSDTGVVVRVGEGQTLPEAAPGAEQYTEIGIDPPEPPMLITTYGGPLRVQVMFDTEAVGEDFDGIIRPIRRLSYRPQEKVGDVELGFGYYCNPMTGEFPKLWAYGGAAQAKVWPFGLPSPYSGIDAANLASQWVFRAYRILSVSESNVRTGESDAGTVEFRIPPDGDAKDSYFRHQIILTPYRVQTGNDQLGQLVTLPGRAYGQSDFGGLQLAKPTGRNEQIHVPFHVYPDRQLFLFSRALAHREKLVDLNGQPVRRPGEDADIFTALATNPKVEVACMIRDHDTNQIIRYKKSFPLNPSYTPRPSESPTSSRPGELPVLKEQIRAYRYFAYNLEDNGHIVREPEEDSDNFPQCERQAKYYAQAEALRFQLKTPMTRKYNGIVPIVTDGCIRQVTWEFSPDGCTTTASYNNEHTIVEYQYAFKRFQQKASLETNEGRVQAQVDALRNRIVREMRNFGGGGFDAP